MKSLPARTRGADRQRIVGGEQQQDLGLERIGVLEFVDENALELRLQMVGARSVSSLMRSRARASRSVKSSAPADRLQLLIPLRGGGELLLEAGGEIGVRHSS